jgi:CRISPR/Cas system endoribonuclease Cas6 (RAMP superfamily)
MIKLLKYDFTLETKACEVWFSKLAEKGLFVTKFDNDQDFIRCVKGTPAKVTYLFYFNNDRRFDETEFIEIARTQGWVNLNKNPINAWTYLFVSSETNPLPLETDKIESKIKTKKNFKFNIIIIFLFIVLMLLLTLRIRKSSMTTLFYTGGFISFLYALTNLNLQPTSFFLKQKNEKIIRRIALTFQMIRRSSLIILLIFPLFIMDPILKTNLVDAKVYSGFLTSESLGYESSSIINKVNKQSFVSLSPIHLASFQALQEDGYTKAYLQTFTPSLFYEDPRNVLTITYEQFMFQENHKTEYLVISQNKSQIITRLKNLGDFEIISFTVIGRNVYGLGTQNVSLNDHLLLIDMMKEKTDVEK